GAQWSPEGRGWGRRRRDHAGRGWGGASSPPSPIVAGHGDPPQREIEPPTFSQQRRGPRQNPVDAVKRQPRLPAEHDGVAGSEVQRAGCIFAGGPADPKYAGVAERQRHNRRLEVALVTVLMQPHLRCRTVIID